MAVCDSLNPSHSHGPFSRVGVSINCSWAVKSAEWRPSSNMASTTGDEDANDAACSSGTAAWRVRATTSAVVRVSSGVVDLEVAETEVVEGMELLGATALDVAVAHVGVLGAVGGRHLPGYAG